MKTIMIAVLQEFIEPAQAMGIQDLTLALFPKSDYSSVFLQGNLSDSKKSKEKCHILIKVPLLKRQLERELMAYTLLGDLPSETHILIGKKLVSKNYTGFAMPRYPYSLDMLYTTCASASLEIQEEAMLKMMQRLVNALQMVHDRGIIHCDIRPENILVDESGEVLADWGCCRRINDPDLRNTVESGYGSPWFQVEMSVDVPMQKMDEIGIIMIALDMLGHLEIRDGKQTMSAVRHAIRKVQLEPLRDILLRSLE